MTFTSVARGGGAIHRCSPSSTIRRHGCTCAESRRRSSTQTAVAIVGARSCSAVRGAGGTRARAGAGGRRSRRRQRARPRDRRRGAPRRARRGRSDRRRARLRDRPRLPARARRARPPHRRDGGRVVSEYPPGVEPAPWQFPARNRIIAGLARATVVVEARQRSGALITADFALELGREVFAVPGEITSGLSAGTNDLIRQGATPLLAVEDVLETLGLEHAPPAVPDTLSAEARAVLARLADGARSLDEIVRETVALEPAGRGGAHRARARGPGRPRGGCLPHGERGQGAAGPACVAHTADQSGNDSGRVTGSRRGARRRCCGR